MTFRSTIKDISIHHKTGTAMHWHAGISNGMDVLEIRHENKLILETIIIAYHFGNMAQIQYTKPYFEKYLGLVVEWIVNNRKTIGTVKITRNI